MDTKFLILDEQTVIREFIKKLLFKNNLSVVGEVSTHLQYLQHLNSNLQWNATIMSIDHDVSQGLKAIKETKLRRPEVKIVVFSIHTEPSVVLEVVRLGVDGYVSKRSESSELLKAIYSLFEGKNYYSADLSHVLTQNSMGQNNFTVHKNLSKREYEILILIAMGRSNAKIGKDLKIHPKTVSSFRSRILEKLHLKTNADLVMYCVSRGLIPVTNHLDSSNRFSSDDHESEPIDSVVLPSSPESHSVQFYADEKSLISGISNLALDGLKNSDGIVLIITHEHKMQLLKELNRSSLNFTQKQLEDRINFVDARVALDHMLVDGKLNHGHAEKFIDNLVSPLCKNYKTIRIYGEIVDLLSDSNRLKESLELEEIWNLTLVKNKNISLVCGYNSNFTGLNQDADLHQMVLATHTHEVSF